MPFWRPNTPQTCCSRFVFVKKTGIKILSKKNKYKRRNLAGIALRFFLIFVTKIPIMEKDNVDNASTFTGLIGSKLKLGVTARVTIGPTIERQNKILDFSTLVSTSKV